MTPTEQEQYHDDVVFEVATEDDIRAAVKLALDEAGLTVAEVIEQGRAGRYTSQDARAAWFVYSSVADVVDLSDLD